MACAGSRKTTSIVEEALQLTGARVLITTYTNENVDQLTAFFVEKAGSVPPHVTIQSWFSFILREGIRPYQTEVTPAGRVGTIDFLSEQPWSAKKSDFDAYFLTRGNDVYVDHAAEFAYEADVRSGGLVVQRLERMYTHLFIDEVQDLAGYDLDLIERLFHSKLVVTAVGDPRQATFHTNKSTKNSQFKGAHIADWVQRKKFATQHWTDCYRCHQLICDFADALYPTWPKSRSVGVTDTGHDGIHRITRDKVEAYMAEHRPVVLRYWSRTNTMGQRAYNIGSVKGRTFARVLIFPTKPMLKYLKSGALADVGDVPKFYVAVTRARHSVAFVTN
jgi:hypothetical protein